MLYNNGIESEDVWRQVSRFFMKEKHKPQHMTLQKFYAEDKFGLLIDLRSMASRKMHGSGTPPHQQHRRGPTGNQEKNRKRAFQLPHLRYLGLLSSTL